jgi:hypothetical protein
LDEFTAEFESDLRKKYDDSTAVIINDCILMKGDELHSIKGLADIQDWYTQEANEKEVQINGETLIILWNKDIVEISEYLIAING